jgi:hypothetical protein
LQVGEIDELFVVLVFLERPKISRNAGNREDCGRCQHLATIKLPRHLLELVPEHVLKGPRE